MRFHTYRMFQSSHHRPQDSPIDANFTTTPQLQMNLILVKMSPSTRRIKPIPAKMPLMSFRQTPLPTEPLMRLKIAVASRDVLVDGDVAVGPRTMGIGHQKLNGHQKLRDHLNRRGQRTRLKGQRRQEVLNHQGRPSPTGLLAVIARHETISGETIHRIETNAAIDGRMMPTDRRPRPRLVTFQNLPKTSEATSRPLTVMSYFRTM